MADLFEEFIDLIEHYENPPKSNHSNLYAEEKRITPPRAVRDPIRSLCDVGPCTGCSIYLDRVDVDSNADIRLKTELKSESRRVGGNFGFHFWATRASLSDAVAVELQNRYHRPVLDAKVYSLPCNAASIKTFGSALDMDKIVKEGHILALVHIGGLRKYTFRLLNYGDKIPASRLMLSGDVIIFPSGTLCELLPEVPADQTVCVNDVFVLAFVLDGRELVR